jgi:uncharacterized RmlC-like cupin family protein
MAECQVRRTGGTYEGKQGLSYFEGVSRESVGSQAICMHLLEMPPGVAARPHYHASHETAIYVLQGTAWFAHGPNLEHVTETREGDFVHIPAGVPHAPFNPSGAPVRAVISRTDPHEQESVVLCPELVPVLNALLPDHVAKLT